MWNGTAAILKPTPAATRITASVTRSSPLVRTPAISRRCVVPESPYMSDMPYSRMPSENAPRRKYFTAASFDRWFGLMKPARM
jgi:hypothetical protein